MSAVEMHYTIAEVSLLLRLHSETVRERMKAGHYGQYFNMGTELRPDWRIPASGVNADLHRRRAFTETEPGVAARSVGELRRKIGKEKTA